MGYPTKVQVIKRKASEQWYIGFPSAVAQAMEFKQSEQVEWLIEDLQHLVLRRLNPPISAMKKKRQEDSSTPSKASSPEPGKKAEKNAPGKGPKRSP